MRSENISTPIYVECDKMYQSKVCVQEFSYLLQVAKHDESYTIFRVQLIRIYGLGVKVMRRESGDMG